MAPGYVPIFFDWMEVTGELNAQEKGRLIDAIVAYAMGGDWQEQIKGNERYLFPAFKAQIDRAKTISEARAAAGRTGGRPSEESKPKQTKANESKQKQTEANESKTANNNNNNNNNKYNNNNKENTEKAPDLKALFARFWEAYPRKTAKQDAEKAFLKLAPTEDMLAAMLSAIEQQEASEQWQEPRYIPHPATWLNGRRWEDKLPAAAVKRTQQSAYAQRDYEEDPSAIPDWLQARMQN